LSIRFRPDISEMVYPGRNPGCPGCDPIEGMARIAMDERADLSIRAQMIKELASYVAPKRRAVEMKAEGQLSLVNVIRAIDQRKDQAQTAQG
jgi:hypothetical protein